MALPEKRNNENGREGMARPWEMDSYPSAPYYPEQRTIKDHAERVLDLLQRRKWVILLVFLLIVALGTVYTYSQVPVYQSSSLVLVNRNDGRQDAQSSSLAVRDEPFSRNDRSLENELMILRTSRTLRRGVAERLIEKGTAQRLFHSEPKSTLERLLEQAMEGIGLAEEESGSVSEESTGSSSSPERLEVGQVAGALVGLVSFSRAEREASVIRITAENTNPEVTALLANAYMEEYLERTQQASRAQLSASREFLEEQVKKRKSELQAIEQKIQQFQSRRGAMALDQEASSLVGRIAQTEAARDEARLKLRMKESSMKSLQEELESIRPEELSQRVGSAVEKEIEALQSKIAELELSKRQVLLQSTRPTAADSAQAAQIERRIRALRARVQSLSDAYVKEVMAAGVSADEGVQRVKDLKRQIAEHRIDSTGLEARIDVLSERLQEYEAELRSIPEQSMELAQLERSRNYTEQMYGFLVEQLQQTRVREESELGYATSLTEANIPTEPVQPNHNRNFILSLLLGLLGGFGMAMVRDRLDNRVYKPDRIGEMGYREVGTIPNLTPLIKDQLNGRAAVEQGDAQLSTSLVSAIRPHSAAAESYRHIQTNIQFGQFDKSIETLLVTSPGAGDGKSVTAANLAVVMAQAGRSTLLIDADLRRPQVHKLFGMSRSPGLSEALQNGLHEHVKAPPVNNLCVLPAGSNVEHPSELLGSSKFRDLLDVAQDYFDVVILDTPPVLAATDATLLSTQCDATLCVVRAGATTEPELARAMQALDDVGARVMGAVFNGFDISMAYGYKLRYRHYGPYGPYDQYQSLPDPSSEA